MKLNELVTNKQFTTLHEWKAFVTKAPRFWKISEDAYDENVMQAYNSQGHVIGFFNLQENYGEMKRS